ncbi:hypothetical protein LSTR_LSTR000834 [Laodelphax striatellus]|uniref:Down syndrome cell adhesion molecule-like protein Dscam2 n=2 Tax=Laodelphax striatellus TaxID=195883 RepID=A0A482WHI1_LAOST|nr:hypothetical protein LSTR_LSTR000834 [Laodelphax striatellus]
MKICEHIIDNPFYSVSLCLRGSAVRGPVFVEEPPPWLDMSNSTGVILSCKAHGTPAPVIHWLDQADKEVTHLPRIREILHNGSLYLPPFSGENFRPDVHSTSYRCLATNSVGTIVSRECKLRPDLQESYPLQVEETMTLRGNIAILRCGVSASHTHKYALSWLKEDSIHGRTTLHPGGRFSITAAGALHIRSVSIEDSYARYYCQVTNRLTNLRRVSRPGKIVVTDSDGNIPPRIEYSLTSVHSRVGATTELECAAQGSPPPSYRWYRIIDESLLEEIRPGSILVRPLDSILQFTRVRVDDSGRYVCVAANILGEDRRELSLAVKSPLTVHIHPQYQVVDGGSTTTINCTIDGGDGGRTVIAWLKDGRSLADSGQFQVQNDGGVLVLNSVTKYDKGMYQCLARNGDETAQASAELVLEAIPPELHSTFIEQTIQPGISVSLHCVASGTPVPRVNWFLNGGPLLTRGGYVFGSYLDSTGDLISQLNITVTRVQHGGLYTCTAKNTLGSVSHSAALNVYGPPTSRAPLNLTVVSGKDVHLLCPVAGFPVSSTTWQFGQDALPASYRQRVFLNGTLLIGAVDVDTDKGEYRCTVRNQQGQAASGKVHLNIMEPPEIQPFHFPEKLQEGKRTQLSCTIVSGDFPIDIAWYKDSRPLTPDSDLQEQNHNFVSVLLFRKLAARHAGHYTCVARNAAAQTNYTAKLVIRVAPSWITEPQDISVLFQHPAAIHCQATGFPKPKITWMKLRSEDSNDFVQVEEILGMRVSANGTLLIRSTEPSHEGSYSCQAANGVGSVLKKNIFVNINVPAYFKQRVVNQSGVAGDDIVVSCDAEGDRPLRLSWSSTPPLQLPQPHNRQTANGQASDLHLRSLTRQDAGAYYCVASNQFGQDNMVIHLAVREPPEAPSRVEVVEVGSRWLSMRWASPNPGVSPVTQYIVQFQEDSSLQWNNVTVSGNIHSTKLNALSPATVYTVRLVAVNEVGAGLPSHTTHAVTLQEVPSKAPEDVIAEANAPESLLIKWRPIPLLSSKEEILGFQVSYREMTKGAAETRTVRGSHKHELQLSGLRSYARYEVTVRAINQVGPGPSSAPLVATTLEGGYVLSYRKQNEEWEHLPLEQDRRSYNLDKLQCGSIYEIELQAINSVGNSKPSAPVRATTKGEEVIPLELIPEEPTHSLVNLNVMVPVVSGVFCTIALTLCACVLSRKRQYTGYKAAETSNSKSIAELENQRNFDQQGHHSPHSLSPPSHKTDLSHNQSRITNDNSGDYEISPYATFSLPNQAAAHSLQFQTFSQHDCYEGRPMKDYHYARGRSKSSSSKIVQDALSLEISCISTQQTLPVGRKGGGGGCGGSSSRNSSTVFMSDSDSSGTAAEKLHSHAHPHSHHHAHAHQQLPSQQSIGLRNTGASSMYDQDSSTESAEASPEMNRKHRSRRLVSPRCRESVPLHPPQGFSDSRELSETECDQNQNCGSGLRILRHEQLEQQLSNLVKKYRQERDREKQDYTIHV